MNLLNRSYLVRLALCTQFIVFLSTAMASEMAGKPLVDFSDESIARQWISVNDDVMGGISEGQFRITDDKTLEFSGNLSLENNGGFASIRTQPADLNLDGYDTIGLRLKGDGRTYYFNLRTSSRNRVSSYRAPIKTQKDTWQDIHIPLNAFVYTSFGRVVRGADPVKAENIQSVGFTLSDKKSGPFKLEVSEIRAAKATRNNETAVLDPSDDSVKNKDIVETAIATGQFKTLVTAVQAAGLVETLKGPGPLTVFAPTDDAFAKLPKATLESLLKAENRPKLIDILTYHVVPGRITAEQVSKLPKADTVQGTSVLISAKDDKVNIDKASVIKADIEVSNGVIHVIDEVLMPKDIVSTAETAGKFKTLLAAADAADLVDALKSKGPLTVFAPTDAAFEALPDGTVEDLLRPENKTRLAAILTYHVIADDISFSGQQAKTLQGGNVDIRPSGNVRVDDAEVLLADVRATNGVIHVIDRVLLPDLPEPTPVRKAMGVIELAIERGVPLFNAGKPEACAAIYEVAARSLLDGYKDALDEKARERLEKAITNIREDHRASQQAWILRYALDDVYNSLRDKK